MVTLANFSCAGPESWPYQSDCSGHMHHHKILNFFNKNFAQSMFTEMYTDEQLRAAVAVAVSMSFMEKFN